MEFYASCPSGFERALAIELKALGCRRVRPLAGRVSFEGDLADAYRPCLESRLASRINAVVARFHCATADDLYDGMYSIAWEQLLRRSSTVLVSAQGSNDALRNTRFIAQCAKDGLVDRMLDETGAKPESMMRDADVHVAVTVRGDRASVGIDLCGEPLFKRHHHAMGDASRRLRSDYAALVLAEGGWTRHCQGAGEQNAASLLICAGDVAHSLVFEAASELAGIKPGSERARWGFQELLNYDAAAWAQVTAGDADRPARGRILLLDKDATMTPERQAMLDAIGARRFVETISPRQDALAKAVRRFAAEEERRGNLGPRAHIVCDLTANAPARLARAIGQALLAEAACRDAGVAVRVITVGADVSSALAIGRTVRSNHTLPMGSDEITLTVLDETPVSDDARELPSVDVASGRPVPVLLPESEQFARRLIKVARLRRRWADREGVSCYRVYDADLPDYAVAIDLYVGSERTPGRWLVVAEYAAPRSVEAGMAQARMLDILAIAPRVLDVEPDHVHAKTRMRSRGGSQYAQATGQESGHARTDRRGLPRICEGGLTFIVNFDDYLDTGIFLDHRVTRDLVRTYARDAETFLNLFAYTGTATCYAADGGARETTTVDLSNTYLEWARDNMRLNGFASQKHRFIRADVLTWIERQLRRSERWDLIFCDPPTFSNSTKMGGRTFDVQRDHVELVSALAHLLTPQGRAIFSCNLRRFKPDLEELRRRGVNLVDITERTIPEDFARNKRIHRCYVVERI